MVNYNGCFEFTKTNKIMKKLLYLTAIIVLFSFKNTHAQINPEIEQELQNTLDSVCNKYKIKGVSAAIVLPGMGTWKGVYGESYMGNNITPNMLFGMGSNTKTFIAATLLIMQQNGQLNLDDSIGKWITGYPNISTKITIRQCLNHTSGLQDYLQNDEINDSILDRPEKVWTKHEILSLAKTPNFAPGQGFSYSNTNYIVAGIIIEMVAQKLDFAAIDELILSPLQLTNTYGYGEQGNKPIAHPWSMSMTGTELTDMTTTLLLNNLFSLANTAGWLITTAEDNANFWYKLCAKQIINDQSWQQMTTMRPIGNNAFYGLGLFRYNNLFNGRTFYSHGGTFFGYINENIFDTTSKVAISVLTNQDSLNNNGLLATVISALHKVTLKLPTTGLNVQEPVLFNHYPNPTNNELTIQLAEANFNGFAEIIDMQGLTILSTKFNNSSGTINTSFVPNGLYVLRISNNSKSTTKKLLINHN